MYINSRISYAYRQNQLVRAIADRNVILHLRQKQDWLSQGATEPV